MRIRHTFELLESKACNAAYFLSLLESKGEPFGEKYENTKKCNQSDYASSWVDKFMGGSPIGG